MLPSETMLPLLEALHLTYFKYLLAYDYLPEECKIPFIECKGSLYCIWEYVFFFLIAVRDSSKRKPHTKFQPDLKIWIQLAKYNYSFYYSEIAQIQKDNIADYYDLRFKNLPHT